MIDSLREILGLFESVPEMAIWGAVLFFAFKLIVYLSTTGAIMYALKLVAETLLKIWKTPKAAPEPEPVIRKEFAIGSYIIENAVDRFIVILGLVRAHRNRNQLHTSGFNYLHASDIAWLEHAVRAQIMADERHEREKAQQDESTKAEELKEHE